MTEIHLIADSDVWTGQSTCALHAARSSAGESVVLTAMTDGTLLRRFEDAGVRTVECKASGMFGALNLSRVLRRLEGDSFRLYVYDDSLLKNVESALRLVGRKEPFEPVRHPGIPEFTPVSVKAPGPDDVKLLMWLGNITETSGLDRLIERLGSLRDRQWRLRVVGQGKAKVVSPILKRCRALGIHDRIEWVGYSANPYEEMDGVSLGIVTSPSGTDSVVAREFAAASIPVITNLSELNP